jgi:hypothetical protein
MTWIVDFFRSRPFSKIEDLGIPIPFTPDGAWFEIECTLLTLFWFVERVVVVH